MSKTGSHRDGHHRELSGAETCRVVGGEQESENKDDSIRTGRADAAQANLRQHRHVQLDFTHLAYAGFTQRKCQSLSCVQFFATPWTAACQAPLPMGLTW